MKIMKDHKGKRGILAARRHKRRKRGGEQYGVGIYCVVYLFHDCYGFGEGSDAFVSDPLIIPCLICS